MTIRHYVGLDQPDIASIDYGGVTYVAFVALGVTAGRVEGAVITKGASGQEVILDLSPVRVPSAGIAPDCPRVLGLQAQGLFIAHWVEIEENVGSTLHRAYFDLDDIGAGWQYIGSTAIHNTALYDAAVITNQVSDVDFVVTRRTAVGTIITARFASPYAWGSFDWSTSSAVTMADNVLAIVADDDDDAVLVHYQEASLLNTLRLNASDGLGPATQELFADLLDGDNQFTAVAAVRVAADSYLVAAEVATDDDLALAGVYEYSRLVAWRFVRGTDAVAQDNSHWVRNVHLASSPWAWSGGTTNEVEVYLGLSHKSLSDGQEFVQSYGYVAKVDVTAISSAVTAGVVYPIPVGAWMDGSFDGRCHGDAHAFSSVTPISDGTARMNHVSNVAGPPLHTLGPDAKSVTFAHLRYSRLIGAYDTAAAALTELLPASTKVSGMVFHHEPQVMIRRYELEPTQPDTPAWRGVPRASALPLEIPGFLTFSGGVTQVYDGYQLCELGYLWTPELLSVDNDETGNDITDGDYWYTLTYAWNDAKGQLHRSPPAVPRMVTVAGTMGGAGAADLLARCVNLSMKDDTYRYPSASTIAIEVWRTYLVSGSTATGPTGEYLFRRVFANASALSVHQLQDTPQNDKGEFAIAIHDTVQNDELSFQELLPWQLDVNTLQWTPPPPIPHVPLRVTALWQARLFGYDSEAKLLRWSEQITRLGTQYIAPEFLDTNTYQVDDVGEITALAAMDNALFVFTARGVFALRGDPGAGGVGVNLDLDTIPGAPGCLEPRSVVVSPQGIYYQSPKGIYGIGRETGVSYIGAPVEDIVREAGNLRSAVVLEDRHQVRWTCQALPGTGPLAIRPRILTYDYRLDLWCTALLPMFGQSTTTSRLNEMIHATVWQGRQGEHLHVILAQGGCVVERADDDTVYADEGAAATVGIPLDVTTEWIHVQMGQVHRIWEIEIVTRRINTSALTIEAWYDIDGTWDSDDGAAQQTQTIASPSDTIRFRPRPSKCRGIKLRIYESGTVAQTENVRLVALRLHFGVKPGQQGVRNTA